LFRNISAVAVQSEKELLGNVYYFQNLLIGIIIIVHFC